MENGAGKRVGGVDPVSYCFLFYGYQGRAPITHRGNRGEYEGTMPGGWEDRAA